MNGPIAVDGGGNAYIAGMTASSDFPITPGAYQTTLGPLAVTKLNSSGTALVYSTYLGSNDPHTGHVIDPFSITVDPHGSAVIAGALEYGAAIPVTVGAPHTCGPCGNVLTGFVTKLGPTGSSLEFSDYVGEYSVAFGAVSDAAGNVFVGGLDLNGAVVTTTGAFQTAPASNSALFVQKYSSSGSVIYSTYISGNQGECIDLFGECEFAVDAVGDAFVAGVSYGGYPTTPGAFNTTAGPAFVTKLNPSGSGLVYSTYLGGFGIASGLAVDPAGHAFITGLTTPNTNGIPTTPGAFSTSGSVFVTEVNATGSALVYSTRFTAELIHRGELPGGLALTKGGDIWITGSTGETASSPMSVKDPIQEFCGCFYNTSRGDAYVAKIRPAGHGKADLLFSTFLGGTDSEYVASNSVAVDGYGNAYVTGQTLSHNFPVTPAAFQPTNRSTFPDSQFAMNLYAVKIVNVCETPITGTVTGDVNVGPGAVACLMNAKVSGSVTVQRGGDLSIDNSSILGSVTATAASSVTLCKTNVGAGVSLSNTTGFVRLGSRDIAGCRGNHFTGNVSIKNNKGGLEVGGNQVTGNVTVNGTSGIPFSEGESNPDGTLSANPEIEGNTISGNLSCSGNTPPPANDLQPNRLSGASVGQCAGL